MAVKVTSRAWSHCFLRMKSDKASVTVLAQALALFLRSIFFLRFLMGWWFLLVDLPFPFPYPYPVPLVGIEGSEIIPGYSPSFQCLFFSTEFLEEEEEVDVDANDAAQRKRTLELVVGRWWSPTCFLDLRWRWRWWSWWWLIGEGKRDEENDIKKQDDDIPGGFLLLLLSIVCCVVLCWATFSPRVYQHEMNQSVWKLDQKPTHFYIVFIFMGKTIFLYFEKKNYNKSDS
ncbi:hypothetical protein CsSME_00021406 [Camellia sinensis var. sinensis]